MQDIKDMYSVNDNVLQKVKKESVAKIMQDDRVKAFLKDNNLSQKDVEDNWNTFLLFVEDNNICNGCRSIDNCHKNAIGRIKALVYEYGNIHLDMSYCKNASDLEKDNAILRNMVFKNVPDSLVLKKVKDITILKDENTNVKSILKNFSDYCNNPSSKGFYLQGKPGTGKSTLMGLLTRQLAKKGTCGYISFPSFLLELKSSFDNDSFSETMRLINKIDYLIIDDLGDENITPWSRDEILSTIVSNRLSLKKPIFFVSNYKLEDLSKLYLIKKDNLPKVENLISNISASVKYLELKGKDLR
ncbi:MAG: ATP-binding protein [Thomasclavelia sp.]|nr:ATP-binding protein [Thomasclavelia sp.]